MIGREKVYKIKEKCIFDGVRGGWYLRKIYIPDDNRYERIEAIIL